MSDPAIQAQIDALQAIYDELVSGATVVEVVKNGRKIRYQAGNIQALNNRINQLKAQCKTPRRGAGKYIW